MYPFIHSSALQQCVSMSPLSISNTKDSKSWWRNAWNNDHHHQHHFDDQHCRQRSLSPSSELWSTPENSLEMTAFWTTPSFELSLEEEEALIEREKERTKMAAILELEDVFMEGEQQQQQHCQASAFSSLHHSPNATHQNIKSSSSSSSSSIIVKVYTPNEDFDDDCFEAERPATRTLHITHLVAPFDVHALKRQLEAFGPISEGHFWISRTQCFVHFESVEAAARARLALHRRRWPPASPRLLEVTFVEEGRHPACWRLRPMVRRRR